MTSKNLFFKLMTEDGKRRLWAIALVSLLFFFSFPVAVVFISGTRHIQPNVEWIKQFSKIMFELFSKENPWTATIISVLAMVCAASGFTWLDSRKKVDFYHSIPVKREKLFAVNYISGILITAIPYLVGIVAGMMIAVSQGVPFSLFLEGMKGWVYFMVYYLLLYATVVIAVVMTGNLVVAMLGTMVFFFYGPLLLSLTEGYFRTWFYTFCDEGRFIGHASQVSPFINYCMGGELSWKFFLSHLAAGILLTVIALLLYRKRPSEAAGKAMAFQISKPIIRILIVMVSALSGAIFFWELRNHIGWAVFGIITGCLISHCVIEIIYNFDFKKLFSHYKQMIACFALSFFIFLTFRYDLFGYDRYMPKEGQVESSAILVQGLEDWVDYGRIEPYTLVKHAEEEGENLAWGNDNGSKPYDRPYVWTSESNRDYLFREMKLSDTETIFRIAQNGIEKAKEKKEQDIKNSNSWLWTGYGEDGKVYAYVTIQYRFKNGRTLRRQYRAEKAAVKEDIIRLFNSEEYKESVYPLLAMKQDQVAAAEIGKGIYTVEVGKERASQLLEAYQEELRTMKFEDMEGLIPIGTIRFFTEDRLAMKRWEENRQKQNLYDYYYGVYDQEQYPVYECFENFLSLLNEEEAYDTRPENEHMEKLVLRDDRSCEFEGTYTRGLSAEITQEEEIQELLPLLKWGDYMYYNSFGLDDREFLTVSMYLFPDSLEPFSEKGGYDSYNYYNYEVEVEAVYEDEYSQIVDYIIDVRDVGQKYLKRIQYDEMTEKMKKKDGLTSHILGFNVPLQNK